MKQLKEFLKADRLLHFSTSAFIFFALMIAFKSYDVGIISSVVIFIGKELYDKYVKKTYFDIIDALASFFGVVFSLVYWSIFN